MATVHTGDTAGLKAYWAFGEGAAKIRWGTDGDFLRCKRLVNEAIVKGGNEPLDDREIGGYCFNLHVAATGARPGQAPGEKR